MESIKNVNKLTNLNNSLNSLIKTYNELESIPEHNKELVYVAGIARFNVTFELVWKTLKDFIQDYGQDDKKIQGSKDLFRAALSNNIIEENDIWFQMIDTRNKVIHEYLQQDLEETSTKIQIYYLPELIKLTKTMNDIYEKNSFR